METDEIIVNLKIISKIEKGDRLTTTTSFLNIEQTSLIPQCVRRWKQGEGRNETIRKINIVINNALLSKTDINDYLYDCITGITNLQDTYSTDLQTCSRLDTIIDKIKKALPPVDL